MSIHSGSIAGDDEAVKFGIWTSEAVLHHVRALKAEGPRELADRERLNTAFDARLSERWGAALELYCLTAMACERTGEDAYRRGCAIYREENSLALLQAIVGLHALACRQAWEVHTLLRHGFPKGAHVVARSMHEAAVMACVLAQYGTTPGHEDLGVRFLLFDELTTLMDAEEHQLFVSRLNEERFSEAEMDAFRKRKVDVLARFPDMDRKNGWLGELPGLKRRTFEELEVIAGIDHLRPYYTWASHEVHATPKGVRLNMVMGPNGGSSVMLAGRTNAGLADPAQGALIALVQITANLNTLPGLATPSSLISARAAQELLDEACNELALIELEITAEEAALAALIPGSEGFS